MSGRIRSIRWSHAGETVTCTIGEDIKMEYLSPESGHLQVRFDGGPVNRIEDAGACFFVWHEFDELESEWPSVFLVGKHHSPVIDE
ncbi:MAG TPA: hypothetical protein VK217_00900 [Acidimicrobiales bacterium]|nr:hypothetical protein [Acidimicrobiales bacterium]